MKRLVAVLAALFGLVAVDSGAQVYIWRDPGSKTVHLDSSAPSWYSYGDGPRTQLFIDGALIDDTRWKERNVIRFRVYERWNAGAGSSEQQVAFGTSGRYQGYRERAAELSKRYLDEHERLMSMQDGGVGAAIVAQGMLKKAQRLSEIAGGIPAPNQAPAASVQEDPWKKLSDQIDRKREIEKATRDAIRSCRDGLC